MRARNFSIVVIIALFFSGCVVFSFYPLYTEEDLFPNDLLTGEWIDGEDTHWSFTHPYKGKKELGIRDSSSYVLILKTTENDKTKESKFYVHVVKLAGHYFLDFYAEAWQDEIVDLATFHMVPIHTFAKLTIENDVLQINWFDHDWLDELIKENKIRIHHEKNDDYILLTAKPKELQKFVTKYINSEKAFENGLAATLARK